MTTPASRQRGFSVIELIAALAVAAVITTGLLLWMSRPLAALNESHQRAAASDQAERIVAWLADEVPEALPNSARVACGGRCLEFIPVVSFGGYRAAAPGDILDLTAADDQFDILKALPATPQSGLQIVINNLNALSAGSFSAYSADPNNNRSTIVAGTSVTQIRMAAKQFPSPSPTQRFYLVGSPVSYLCQPAAGGGTIRRYTGYAIQSAQPTNANLGDLLAEGIADCRFGLTSPDLVSVRLTAVDGTIDPVSFLAQFRLRHEP